MIQDPAGETSRAALTSEAAEHPVSDGRLEFELSGDLSDGHPVVGLQQAVEADQHRAAVRAGARLREHAVQQLHTDTGWDGNSSTDEEGA